jgi:hypothetical protein
MSSDRFDFIIIEIPKSIDKEMVRQLKEAAMNISAEEAVIFNKVLELEADSITGEGLSEDDLFEIGQDSLRIKKAVQEFLSESVSEVLIPRMYHEARESSPLNVGEFAYVTLEGKPYVISGQTASYYSSKMNLGYKYVLALSLSNLLADFLED